MLVPLKPGELQRLVPLVATGPQFSHCWGNPSKGLQRVLVSSIGGVIPLLISQSTFGYGAGKIGRAHV